MIRTTLALATLALTLSFAEAKDDYKLGPDSMEKPGVPHGEIIAYPNFKKRDLRRPVRNFWVYVPKQYDGTTPACFMVFQDGVWYKDPKSALSRAGRFRQSDSQQGNPGDDRHLHQSGSLPRRKRQEGREQPQLRI